MAELLEPCPFCGSEDLDHFGEDLLVLCLTCGAEGPCNADPATGDSLFQWNDRAVDHDAIAAALRAIRNYPNIENYIGSELCAMADAALAGGDDQKGAA